MADFFALNKLLFHCVARCCEASALKKSTIDIKEIHEELVTYNCINLPVDRTKTGTYQDLVLYAHKDNFLHCAYFGLAYKLVLDNGLEDALFPQFFGLLTEADTTKVDSRSSKLYSKYLDELGVVAAEYDPEYFEDDDFQLPTHLTSHSTGICRLINFFTHFFHIRD